MSEPVSPRGRSDLVTRGIIWGGIAVLALMAAFDFRAKHAATRTADAWRVAQAEKFAADEEFYYSELAASIRGNPARATRPARKHRGVARDEETFTWNGVFRSYPVTVYLGLGEDRSVEFIEGPARPVSPNDAGTTE